MEFRILGPLEVRDEEGHELALGPAQQRALLAFLLLHAGELVSSDRLIDALWGDHAPPTAAKIIQNYVSRLRRILGSGRLVTHGHGYVLELDGGTFDLDRFESLASQGEHDLAEGDAGNASERLREALALWRGPPLADFAYEPFAQSAITRLDEQRLEATEERIEADLALGRHAQLVGELEEVIQQHPRRERLHAQLMLALYRSGRQAEALAAYGRIRSALVEELGLEPGEELQALQRKILTHDPHLSAPHAAPALGARDVHATRRPRRARLVIALIVALLVGSAAAVFALTRHSKPPPLVTAGNAVAVVDPLSRRVVDDIALHSRPIAIAADHRAAWIASEDTGTITRLDTKTRRVAAMIAIGSAPSDIAVGEGAVWITNGSKGELIRIDPATDRVVRRIALSRTGRTVPEAVASVVAGAGAVWVATGSGAVLKVNPRTGSLIDRMPIGTAPVDIALSGSNLWVVAGSGYVLRIDTETDKVTGTVPAAPHARAISVGEGAVWVTSAPHQGGGLVWRIDPTTLTVTGPTTLVDQAPVGVASGGNAIWVAGGPSGTLLELDPPTGRIAGSFRIGGAPLDVAYGGGMLWVAVATRSTPAP